MAPQATAKDELRYLVPTGILLAADVSYQSGDWLAALEELEVCVSAMRTLGRDENGSGSATTAHRPRSCRVLA
jgi:hypothetical protein